MKGELVLSNYATKVDLKNASSVDTSKFAKTFDLASWNSEIDISDIDELETTPVHLSKLSDQIKNEAVKKTVYDGFVKKS